MQNSKTSSSGLEGWLSNQEHQLPKIQSSVSQWAAQSCLYFQLQEHPASLENMRRLSSLLSFPGQYNMTAIPHSHCPSSRNNREPRCPWTPHRLQRLEHPGTWVSTGGPGIKGLLKLQLFLSASSPLPVSFLLLLIKSMLIENVTVLFPEWISVALN